jgi:hypothetical protein
MILTDYYCFKRLEGTLAKLRVDCTASTKNYEPMEGKRATKAQRHTDKRDGCNVGDLFCYFGDVPEQFGGDVHRKADKALTKSKNISSIYTPDPKSNLGFGDMKGTADALLFVFHDAQPINGRLQTGAVIEVFVARGYAKDRVALYNELSDGLLDEEMDYLRLQATPEREGAK